MAHAGSDRVGGGRSTDGTDLARDEGLGQTVEGPRRAKRRLEQGYEKEVPVRKAGTQGRYKWSVNELIRVLRAMRAGAP